MNAYDLPTSLIVGEVAYPINYGWRNAVEILKISGSQKFTSTEKLLAMVDKLFFKIENIPPEFIMEAAAKAKEFLDCGEKPSGKVRPKLMDWEQDAPLIVSAINKEAGKDIRLDPNNHWWTVYNWFRNSSGGLWSNVLHLRIKMNEGKELTKEERRFLNENLEMIELKNKDTDATRRAKDELKELLNGGG